MPSSFDIRFTDMLKETSKKLENVDPKSIEKAVKTFDSLFEDASELVKFDSSESNDDIGKKVDQAENPKQVESTHRSAGHSLLGTMMDTAVNLLNSLLDDFEEASVQNSEGMEVPENKNSEDKVVAEEAEFKDLPENSEKTIEEKQEIADKAAQEYNAKTNPYERTVEKGIEGVKQTENGGVSFEDTDAIYTKEDGTKCIVKIKATGNRSKDFDAANAAMGLDETPDGYVWHHLDDYNVKDGTITLELVKDEAHNASKPHSGGCAQYDAVNGPTYNPPRKGDNANA